MTVEAANVWTLLLGSSGIDAGTSVASTADGSVYISGTTEGSFNGQNNYGGQDAFISKYTNEGANIWTRFDGSSKSDRINDISSAADGSLYTVGTIEKTYTQDHYISKYGTDGSKLWTQLLSPFEIGNSVTTASDGSIYVAGNYWEDGFLSKYNADGSKLWTRILDSTEQVYVSSIATHGDDSVYLTGGTYGSLDGQVNNGQQDAFLSKFSSDGSKVWTRLLGSSAVDGGASVSTAVDGSIYISGSTEGSFDGQGHNGGRDAFISKFTSDGAKTWTRLLGSSVDDSAQSISTSIDGSVYIAGYTYGSFDGQVKKNGATDGFLSKFSSNGFKAWTQLLGARVSSAAHSISTAGDGSIYIAGAAFGNLDGQVSNGSADALLSKYTPTPTPIPNPTPSPAPTVPPVPTPPVATPAPPTPPTPTDDYLNFTPQTLPARPSDATAKYFDYVDRYPLTLKTAFIAANKAGTAPSQALWGQQHWLAAGSKQGRVLEIVTGTEDTNDYGAYVENYGTTLLDIYRASPDSNPASPTFKSLFNWGKDHYNTVGKAAGREVGGGVDWGAIVKQNFDLYTKWQDAKITDPSITAFAYGYRNQNVIKSANGVQVGRDTQEKLASQYVYGLGGNDVLTGTTGDDLLHGGFGDDLIANGNGGTDLVYGGPGKDVFKLHSGGTLNIRDFRKGTDFIQLGDGMTDADVQLVFDGFNNSTSFKKGSETLASVYGTNPNDFSFAQQSEGLDNVFIA